LGSAAEGYKYIFSLFESAGTSEITPSFLAAFPRKKMKVVFLHFISFLETSLTSLLLPSCWQVRRESCGEASEEMRYMNFLGYRKGRHMTMLKVKNEFETGTS
jgi:hypothetical protein